MSASLYLVAMIVVPALGAAVVAALPRERSLLAKPERLAVSLERQDPVGAHGIKLRL